MGSRSTLLGHEHIMGCIELSAFMVILLTGWSVYMGGTALGNATGAYQHAPTIHDLRNQRERVGL